LGTPQVVCYKMSGLTYALAEMFVQIKYFSLVNIIAGREVVKELLQSHLSKDIAAELRHILDDADYRASMLKSYDDIRATLGDGLASANTAKMIVDEVKVGQIESSTFNLSDSPYLAWIFLKLIIPSKS
ncbi:MAG: hypothetical protein IJ894_00055, partial [Bacteroidales bacterium]|nr:hypothetical protein [Bacteroidales bacterium]